jgi:D-glycero-alpha-D-manno-heptose-7-phosphate kinase
MIVSSAPLRVSFNGGGTDIPGFFTHKAGNCLTLTLNKNVYVSVNQSFGKQFRIAYSRIELVSDVQEIEHPIVRNSLLLLGIKDYLEIVSVADIPSSGSGLGSSSAFTIGLLSSLSKYIGKTYSKIDLAKMACEVELEMCKEPIGKQDQYAIAMGGLNHFIFNSDGGVIVDEEITLRNQKHLLSSLNLVSHFYHINRPRDSTAILKAQSQKLFSRGENFDLTSKLGDLCIDSKQYLLNMDFQLLGKALTEGWLLKSTLNGDIQDPEIARLLTLVQSSGAFGGKLLGAGQGGFVLILAHSNLSTSLDELMAPYSRVNFKFSENTIQTWELR